MIQSPMKLLAVSMIVAVSVLTGATTAQSSFTRDLLIRDVWGNVDPAWVPAIGGTTGMVWSTLRLSPNGEELYGIRTSTSPARELAIYRSTRAGYGATWSLPTPVPELAAVGQHRIVLCVGSGGLRMFFVESDDFNAYWGRIPNYWNIYETLRPSLTSPWSAPQLVWSRTAANPRPWQVTPHSMWAGSATEDGLELYFVANDRMWGDRVHVLSRTTAQGPFTQYGAAPVYYGNLTQYPSGFISSDGLNYYEQANFHFGVLWARPSRSAPWSVVELPAQNNAQHSTMCATAGLREILTWREAYVNGYEVVSTRFHGVWSAGRASPTDQLELTVSDTLSPPGSIVLGAFSFGRAPGTQYGSVTIPLNADPLFSVTVGGVPGLATGFISALDAHGVARATFGPTPPFLTGLHMWTAFLTLDPASASAFRVSNPLSLTID